MDSKKNKFTFKIVFSYLLLIILGVIASYYIYNEVRVYISNEAASTNDDKLLKTNAFLAQLYEAESLSKLALQTKNKLNYEAYALKIDSITDQIEELKEFTESKHQQGLLDSLATLLTKKVTNINALRNLRIENQTGKAISSALNEFDKMEESLGIITAEGLAPNLKELSPKAQETIQKVADYLNANIPQENSAQQTDVSVDSVLQVSKNLLKDIEQENNLNENSLAKSETVINRTDLELSQQLRTILTSFEQEMVINSMASTQKKNSMLKRSIRLAVIAALMGFLVVGIFTFILNKDFWKANLYREKLEKEKEYSESLLKSREQLIATVSHDLRTPLNTISGYATLMEASATEKDKDYVAQIKSASNYVHNLVNDLLDFSQLEAGKMVSKPTTFRLDQLIQECATHIASQYPNKEIQLVLDLDDSLEKPIITDAFRLRQILNNLLGNSYKFTEKGRITLTGKVEGKSKSKKLLLKIKDTGIGISKEKQQLIFKEFTQAQTTAENKYGGYGLGLTITKKLTELLNGTISLKSELGQGSTFILKLPVEYGIIISEVDQGKKAITNLKILVFDDDPSFLKLVGEIFTSEGMETLLFSDFNDYKSGHDFEFDLVLTDIEMPRVTGYEIVSQLKSDAYPGYRNQPVIAMTGRRDLSLEHFTNAGFSKLLRKPFTKTELLQILNELFSNGKPPALTPSIQLTNNSSNDFSLETLKTFLGDDQDAIAEILTTFKTDTLKNLKQLSDAVAAYQTTEISQIAHRMLPMFRQLQVAQAIPILEKFEESNNEKYSHKELKEALVSLEKQIKKLLESL